MSELSLYLYQRKKKIADLMKIGVSPSSIADHLKIPETQVRQEYKEYLDDLKEHIQMSASQARTACAQKMEYIEEKTVEAADGGSIAALNLQLRLALVKVKLYGEPTTEESLNTASNPMPMVLEDLDDITLPQIAPVNHQPVQGLRMDDLKQLYINSIGYEDKEQ